jgi:hypothetical protein
MRIVMQKRIKGIYSSWYTIEYIDSVDGIKGYFNIYPNQARCYPQAIRFWNKYKSTNRKAFLLRNSAPHITTYYC